MTLNSTADLVTQLSEQLLGIMSDDFQLNHHINIISSNSVLSNLTDIVKSPSGEIDRNESFGLDEFKAPASYEAVIILSVLFCCIGAVGLLGNCLVIIVVLLDRKMRQSVTNIFITNLAIADFIIMIFGVPEIVQFMLNRGWLLGTAVCKINRFLLVVALYVSILSLVSVCIERFVAIVYPIKAHILCGRRKIIFAVLLVWPIAIGCGMPTVIFNTVQSRNPGVGAEYCMIIFPHISNLILFQYMEFLLFYFVPVFIQIILYAVIGRKLYASTDELHTRFQMRPDLKCRMDRSTDTIKARKNVVKMLVASVLVYIICYAPPQILMLYNTLSPRKFQVTWSWQVFSYVISYINSAANPVLYCIFSQNFRRNFKKYLCFICLKKPQTYQKVLFESFESKVISRKISSSPTTVSRL